MQELLPLCLGVMLGISLARGWEPSRKRVAVLAAAPLGLVASWANGELGGSAWMVVFDTLQVFAACAATIAVVRRFGEPSGAR